MHAHGVHDLNRWIQRRFRARDTRVDTILGDEQIGVKDKVIQLRNQTRKGWTRRPASERGVPRQRRDRDGCDQRQERMVRRRVRRTAGPALRLPGEVHSARTGSARARLRADGPQGAGKRLRDRLLRPSQDRGCSPASCSTPGSDPGQGQARSARRGRGCQRPLSTGRARALGDGSAQHEPLPGRRA